MKINTYKVIEQAVEQGVAYGIRRFYKHREDECPNGIEEVVSQEVMTEIASWISFDEECND